MNLTELQHSMFLQALGSAIINSLWQSFLLWIAYEGVCIYYKKLSARFKNNLSTIFLFSSFIWFVVTFFLKIYNQPVVALPNVQTAPVITNNDSNSIVENILSLAGAILPYLSFAYILLLMFLFAKLFTAYRFVYFISNKHLLAPPEALQDFTSKVASDVSINKKISLWISEHIDVPATVGFLKPIILIPLASLNNLSPEQMEAIILHELSHIKRNDFFINICISVAETILFFNPFVVLLSKAAKRERENCCDDFVLRYQYDPHSYATALLRLEQSRTTSMKLALGAVSGKDQLLSRIKRITNDKNVTKQLGYGKKLLALLLVTGIITSLAWLAPSEKNIVVKKNVAQKKTEDLQTVVSASPNKIDEISETTITKNNKTFSFSKHKSDEVKMYSETPSKIQMPSSDFGSNWQKTMAQLDKQFPKMLLDGKKYKLPVGIILKNFLPNKDFVKDLSKENLDVNQLNENLEKAYEGIKSVNWDNVQNEIGNAFEDANFQNLFSKQQLNKLLENARLYTKQVILEKLEQAKLEKTINDKIKLEQRKNQDMVISIASKEQDLTDSINDDEKIVSAYNVASPDNNAPLTFVDSNQQTSAYNLLSAPLPNAHIRHFIQIQPQQKSKTSKENKRKKAVQFSFNFISPDDHQSHTMNVDVQDEP